MPVVLRVWMEANVAKDLHADDGVDEEEHGDEQDDIGEGLERLHEGPEEDADGVALPQQLHQAGSSEQTEKADVDEVFLRKMRTVRSAVQCSLHKHF